MAQGFNLPVGVKLAGFYGGRAHGVGSDQSYGYQYRRPGAGRQE